MRSRETDHAPDDTGPQPQPKRKRSNCKAVALRRQTAPASWPELMARAAKVAKYDPVKLREIVALQREIEIEAERRAFDQDFASLQAEIGRVAANAYDPQKRNAYADRNALDDAVRPLIAAKGMSLTYASAPSPDGQSLVITATVSRNGAARQTSVVVHMDGVGLKGNSNMSPAQASSATFSYGQRMAMTALFNLTVNRQKAQEPPNRPDLFDPLAQLRRAASLARDPPSDDEIVKLAMFLRERGEPPDAVIVNGALERSAVKRFVIERRAAQS
jgi:ERF superfamily